MRYRFDSYIFDTDNAQLRGPQGEIALRPITVLVLRYLIENAQRLIGHEELLDKVWGRQAVSVGVVSQSIRELRQALGDSARNSRFIETKHKLGYRFLLQPEPLAEATDGPDPAAADTPSVELPARTVPVPEATSGRFSSGARAATVIVLGSVVVALLVWRPWHSARDAERAETWPAVEVLHDGRPREPQALAWHVEGIDALRRDDLLTARDRFERVLKREPGSVAAMTALADTRARSGMLVEARAWAASAAAAAGGLPRTDQLRLEGFRAGLEYRRNESIAALQALHQLDPGDADAGFRLLDALIDAARMNEAGELLGQLDAMKSPAVDRARLGLMKARMAAIRGDQKARAQAAEAAFDLASSDHARVDALLELAAARMLAGDLDEVRASLSRIDALLQATPWPAAAPRRQMIGATLLREEGKFAESIASFDAAAESALALGQRSMAMTARRDAAFVMTNLGEHARAVSQLTGLLEESKQLGDPRAEASTLDVLSIAQQRAGDLEAAEVSAKAALQACLETGDIGGEASARNNLGMLLARSGRTADAQEQWEKALALFERGGDRRGEATTRSNLAILYARAGRVDAAREANEAALVAFREVDATLDVARLQFNLGVQDRRAGRIVAAEARFRESLDGFSRMRASDFRLQVIASLGELLLLRADLEGADTLLSAVELDEGVPAQRRAAIETARARQAALRGENESADAGFRLALELRERAGLEDWVRMSELDLSELAARQGRLEAAEQSARELRRAMRAGNDAHAAAQAGVLLAGTLIAQGRVEQAERMLDDLEKELLENPDALLTLRVDLLRASLRPASKGAALERVAARARDTGFELLALRAEMLAEGSGSTLARAELGRRGVAVDGMPPPIPY